MRVERCPTRRWLPGPSLHYSRRRDAFCLAGRTTGATAASDGGRPGAANVLVVKADDDVVVSSTRPPHAQDVASLMAIQVVELRCKTAFAHVE